jgi:hypothetical protein
MKPLFFKDQLDLSHAALFKDDSSELANHGRGVYAAVKWAAKEPSGFADPSSTGCYGLS